MIIGLTGKKSHGKDTVGAYLVERHGFTRVSFADALKESAAALFGVPVETWDALKNNSAALVTLTYEAGGIGVAMTVREFLQRYGTEAHRDVFGGTFWTDVVAEKLIALANEERDVVVTDVRFDEERALVKEHGGTVVNVYRPSVVDAGDKHASEMLPDFDFTLWNGGSITDLHNTIEFDLLRRGLPDGRGFGSKFTDERTT